MDADAVDITTDATGLLISLDGLKHFYHHSLLAGFGQFGGDGLSTRRAKNIMPKDQTARHLTPAATDRVLPTYI